jgi:DNA-binding GntR family transcriptional regulator
MEKNNFIQVSTVNEEVYIRLRDQITCGEIAPGTKISIRSIADQYGVSTMPVREAMRTLQAEGFINIKRRSVIVNELSLSEVKQIFAIRKNLEPLAIEWALPYVHSHDIEELRKILNEMDKDDITHNEWQQLNKQFHLRFYKLSNSRHLIKLLENVWSSVTPYMFIYTYSVTSLNFAQNQHYSILKLIEDRNITELTELTMEHLDYTYRVILAALEKGK